jgi:hypothetical protein
MQNSLSVPFCSAGVALVVSLSTLCLAQSTPTTSRVTVSHVKAEMLNEWLDLQKNEVVPALKKAGVRTRTVYSSALFGTAGEYLVVQPFEKYAEFDGEGPLIKALGTAGAARLNEKLRKCLASQNSYAINRLSDISNVIDGPPATVLVTVRYRIAPGRLQDFENLVKSDILPVYKKAKVGLTVNQRGPGTNTTDVTMSTAYFKMADLDGGPFLVKQLGQDGATKINAKFTGMRTLMDVVVRNRVADLSF